MIEQFLNILYQHPILNVLSFVVFILAVWMLLSGIFSKRHVQASAHIKRTEEIWRRAQLERAKALMESNNEDEILLGLEIYGALSGSKIPSEDVRTLTSLMENSNPYVTRQVKATIEMLQ
jgi:hypothetical protein